MLTRPRRTQKGRENGRIKGGSGQSINRRSYSRARASLTVATTAERARGQDGEVATGHGEMDAVGPGSAVLWWQELARGGSKEVRAVRDYGKGQKGMGMGEPTARGRWGGRISF